ncbi:MAG: enoyl-CoA hydratase/isomerase family protein [Halioglobus sp.]|nr:enoyl-CoA hydratase/isomerase family protein [Halioglobus sp.]
MTDYQYLTLTRTGRVLTVSFDSGTPVNSLSNALMRELTRLAIDLQQDSQLNAIVLTGRGDTFSAGMDLKDPENAAAANVSIAEQRTLLKIGPTLCQAWEALDPVTIVAIEGWCIGGGAALAAACDWRVMAGDAHFYVPELKLGMNMSWQSVPRFVNLIGPARTKQLLILAEPQTASVCADWGLADHISAPGQALAAAQALAEKVAAMPPIPVRMAKRAITTSATALNQAVSFMDADQFLTTSSTEDALEGALAFFEKRPGEFTGN